MLLTEEDLKTTEIQQSIRDFINGTTGISILRSIRNSIMSAIMDSIRFSVNDSIYRRLKNATR